MAAVSRVRNVSGVNCSKNTSRKKLWKSMKEHKMLYLMMLPGLLFCVIPLLTNVWSCYCI